MLWTRLIIGCCWIVFWSAAIPPLLAQELTTDGRRESARLFHDQIAPLLQSQCVRCHGAQKQESDLRLDQWEGLTTGGQRGPAIDVGHPETSWLYRALLPDDELQMPPGEPPIAEETRTAVARWIELGAVWPDEVRRLELVEPGATEAAREYWAFRSPQPVTPPELLDASDAHWSQHEIDRFIASRARAADVEPMKEASRATLIRRLSFDLTGRPPTWDEVQSFASDSSPDAYEQLVDRLLDRPEYGQRWARHWLDLVRYAESDGFKADVFRPHAWHYRDYVVRSLNADKPYDRFVQEQIAGDELFPGDMDARVATGYLRLWPLEDNQKDVERQWTLVLQDITEVTSEVVMGLGLRCARCHDHKYDPISQRDYYRFQAFFAALLPRDDLSIPVTGSMQSLADWEQQTRSIRREMRQMENQLIATRKKTIEAYPPYLQAMYARPVRDWGPLDHQYAYLARPQVEKLPTDRLEFPGEMKPRWEALHEDLQQHQTDIASQTTPVMCVTDVGEVAPPTYVNQDPTRDAVEPGYPMAMRRIEEQPNIVPQAGQSTGRRAALARWLTRHDHPLTARVLVNRVWQQYFGRGIVATPNDFGQQGTPPTHPELLDYLATQFVRDGWSLKQLHRRIVLSATYRQAALDDATNASLANSLFIGHPSRRLDGEQIRDAMLSVSGELVPYRAAPGTDGQEPVPSIQLKNVRNRPDEWIFAFDGPDMFNSCARRYTTTTPLQSLLVVNSPWSLDRAAKLAERLFADDANKAHEEVANSNEATNAADPLIRAAFRSVLGREPLSGEVDRARRLWSDEPSAISLTPMTDLCHVLLCSNEFIYID